MMGGVFVALYPSRTRVLMNCTASVAGWRQKMEFLLMTSMLRRPRTVPKPVVNRAVNAFAGATTAQTRFGSGPDSHDLRDFGFRV
jgi:3-oxoadipate enol-lactonase